MQVPPHWETRRTATSGQGVASAGVKGVARAVGEERMVPDVPVPRIPRRAEAALKGLRARVQRGTRTSLGFQPP